MEAVILKLNHYFKNSKEISLNDFLKKNKAESISQYQFRRALITILNQRGFEDYAAVIIASMITLKIFLAVKYTDILETDLKTIITELEKSDLKEKQPRKNQSDILMMLLNGLIEILSETDFLRKSKFNKGFIQKKFKELINEVKIHIDLDYQKSIVGLIPSLKSNDILNAKALELKDAYTGIESDSSKNIKYWFKRFLYNVADKIGQTADDILYQKFPYLYE